MHYPLRMFISLLLTLLLVPTCGNTQSLPKNASPNDFGDDWTCNRGFRKSGDECVAVVLPKNASINAYGNGWVCNRGFRKSGDQCVAVVFPKNASINAYGNGWACNRGFRKSGDQCVAVLVPKDASINAYGNGWACNTGFRKSGEQCVRVVVPPNAQLDPFGTGWVCNEGFKKSANTCSPMTVQEMAEQRERKQAVLEEILRRQQQGISGDHCETEYQTGAEVCVELTDGDLDCNESLVTEAYDECDVNLYFDVATDYRGGASLSVEVECNAEINYNGAELYFSQSDSEWDTASYSLYAHGAQSDSMTLSFSFGFYPEVTSVEVSSLECRIDSVDLW